MKPHNLMLDDDWNIKLIDFGDAKDLNEPEPED
jgi:serine/threonine protein kinase